MRVLICMIVSLVIIACTIEKIVSKAESDIDTTTKTTDTIPSMEVRAKRDTTRDTTVRLQPIEFTVEVKDWEDVTTTIR